MVINNTNKEIKKEKQINLKVYDNLLLSIDNKILTL